MKVLETIVGLALLGVGMVCEAKKQGISFSTEAQKFGKREHIKEYRRSNIDEQIRNYRRESNPYLKAQMLQAIQTTINMDICHISGDTILRKKEALTYCEKYLRNCPDEAVRSMLEKKKVMLENQIKEQTRKENIRFS